jgi:hypothetical protein
MVQDHLLQMTCGMVSCLHLMRKTIPITHPAYPFILRIRVQKLKMEKKKENEFKQDGFGVR